MSNYTSNTDEFKFQVKLIEVTDAADEEARERLQDNCTHIAGNMWLFEGEEYALDGVTFTVVCEEAMGAYGDLSTTQLIAVVSDTFRVSLGEVIVTDDDCIGDDELYTDWYRCPRCGDSNITASFNYCPHCGVRVKLVDPWHKD